MSRRTAGPDPPGSGGALLPTLAFALPDEALEQLAELLARRVQDRLAVERGTDDRVGYLAPAAAAEYLGVSKKRVYDLKSMGALVPDGYDGRTPLFTRGTLDAYVRT